MKNVALSWPLPEYLYPQEPTLFSSSVPRVSILFFSPKGLNISVPQFSSSVQFLSSVPPFSSWVPRLSVLFLSPVLLFVPPFSSFVQFISSIPQFQESQFCSPVQRVSTFQFLSSVHPFSSSVQFLCSVSQFSSSVPRVSVLFFCPVLLFGSSVQFLHSVHQFSSSVKRVSVQFLSSVPRFQESQFVGNILTQILS